MARMHVTQEARQQINDSACRGADNHGAEGLGGYANRNLDNVILRATDVFGSKTKDCAWLTHPNPDRMYDPAVLDDQLLQGHHVRVRLTLSRHRSLEALRQMPAGLMFCSPICYVWTPG